MAYDETGTDYVAVVAVEGLTPPRSPSGWPAGKTNDVPDRASRSVSEIVRANVFTRFNAILGVLLDHRAGHRFDRSTACSAW